MQPHSPQQCTWASSRWSTAALRLLTCPTWGPSLPPAPLSAWLQGACPLSTASMAQLYVPAQLPSDAMPSRGHSMCALAHMSSYLNHRVSDQAGDTWPHGPQDLPLLHLQDPAIPSPDWRLAYKAEALPLVIMGTQRQASAHATLAQPCMECTQCQLNSSST